VVDATSHHPVHTLYSASKNQIMQLMLDKQSVHISLPNVLYGSHSSHSYIEFLKAKAGKPALAFTTYPLVRSL
jgi:hypothetical protein